MIFSNSEAHQSVNHTSNVEYLSTSLYLITQIAGTLNIFSSSVYLSHSNTSFRDIYFSDNHDLMDSITFAVVPRPVVVSIFHGCGGASFRAPAGAVSFAQLSQFSQFRRPEAIRFASNGSTSSVPVSNCCLLFLSIWYQLLNFMTMKIDIGEIELVMI